MRRLLLLLSLLHLGAASAPGVAPAVGDASGAGRRLRWQSPPPPPPVPAGTYYVNAASCTLTGIAVSSLSVDSSARRDFQWLLADYFKSSERWEVNLTSVAAVSSSSVTIDFTIRSGGTATGDRITRNVTSLVADPSTFLAALKLYASMANVTSVSFTPPTFGARVPSPDSAPVPPYSPPSPAPPRPPFPSPPPGFTYAVPTFSNSSHQAAHINSIAATLASSNMSTSNSSLLVKLVADSLNDPTSMLNANATAAAAVRESLLTALVNATTLNASTSADLELVSTAVVSLVANASQISPGGAVSALKLLSSVAGAGSAVSIVASHAVADSLSSLVTASRAPNSTLPVATLGAVLGVVNTLSGSLLVGAIAGSPPLSVSSAAVKLLVQVDAPGDARLYNTSFTVAGSSSSFQPLPASLLSNLSGSVATTFTALTFDPYATVNDPDSTGITSLVLLSQASGRPFNVSGLTHPIFFTLPPPKLGDVGTTSVQCQFWDTVALRYSTAGCVAQPDPQPPSPDHNIEWASGFNATSDADMLRAWTGSGPLYAGCTRQVLDCSAPSPGVVFPNPASPLEEPAVACGSNASAPMLVFVGSTCQLLNTSNAYNCTWDNYLQAFVGGGCEITGDGVQCACRHVRTGSFCACHAA